LSGRNGVAALRLPPGARPGPPLTVGFDRAAHRRTDADWLARAWADALVVLLDEGRTLVSEEPSGLVLAPAGEVDPSAERYFLGEDARGRAYFAVETPITAPPGALKANVREVGDVLPEPDASLFVTAVALVNWHAGHRHSPRTGRPTTAAQGGWTRVTDDGETLFPRTDPAVIVLVHDGVAGPEGRCLLGHNGAWTAPGWARRYSCLAGFVEPGEPAEATVIREIAEEVGVQVRDARYVASQAWPFPGSLMLGYLAVADPDQPVRVDADEITDARWFTRAEVARSLAGDETDFGLPMAASIAHYLIQTWLSGSPAPVAGP
jgi:NAD+ diphosphatase